MPISERRLKAAGIAAAALSLLLAGYSLWPSAAPADVQELEQADAGVARNEPQSVRNDPDARLTEGLRAIVRRALSGAVGAGVKTGSAHVSAVVKELGTDGLLVDLDGDRSLRPASNLKLATTAAALTLLGAGASFETHFDSAVEPVDGVLSGDLIVRAGADPLFVERADGRVIPLLEPWVKSLRERGVEQVSGDLILDLGTYAAPGATPGWPAASQHWQDYCALSSGFSANAGCVSVIVEAGQAGGPAEVRVSPSCQGMLLDLAVSTTGKKTTLTVSAVVSEGKVRVRGNIPADVTSYIRRFAHPDPVGLFGGVLRRALQEGGVRIDGQIRRRRDVPAPIRLASLRRPIMDALVPINTDSNNAVADQLFLKLGFDILGEGSRSGGERAVLTAFERLEVDSSGWRQVEGSGLSRNNRVSSSQLVMLLDAVLSGGGAISDAYAQSLAVAGESGTLSDRMSDPVMRGKVIAKTGFIGGTSALSGLVRGLSGRVYVFSVLVNYPVLGGLNKQIWKPMQDSICELIVLHG
jgi:serine-type D-Ala-D-Ala carboxypeptidase/endopeptidase (penicillin-binding protein 4)